MLMFSGLAGLHGLDDAYQDCVSARGYGDPACTPLYVSPDEAPIATATSHPCDFCNSTTQWCDGSRCIPFTSAEQAEVNVTKQLPVGLKSRAVQAPTAMAAGIPLKVVAILAGLGLIAYLYKQRG
jgi:hypothetical protein